MKHWIIDNPVLSIIAIWFLISLSFNFLPLAIAASPSLISMLLIPGLPTVIGISFGFISIFNKNFFLLPARGKVRVLILTAVLLLLSLGVVAFLIVFSEELYIQMTCFGGDCAQGGIGVFMYIPISWISYLCAWGANNFFREYRLWPDTLNPEFSFRKIRIKAGCASDAAKNVSKEHTDSRLPEQSSWGFQTQKESVASTFEPKITSYKSNILFDIILSILILAITIFLIRVLSTADKSSTHHTVSYYSYYHSQFMGDNNKILFYYNNSKSNIKGTFIYEINNNRLYKPPDMNSKEYPTRPMFSYDRKKITFVSDKNRGSNIYVMNADGSDMRQLTFSRGIGETASKGRFDVETNAGPSFSPDGRLIIFKRANTLTVKNNRDYGISKTATGWDIYEIDIDTGKEHKLTNINSFLMSDPYYLSDGKRFIFWGSIDSEKIPIEKKDSNTLRYIDGIYLMDGMESLPNLIIPSTWWIPGPHISSNDKIIFRDRSIEKNGAQKNTINYELFTYDNGKIKQLTKIGASISQLSISPDGSRAVFSVEKNGEEENSIWIVNTDGSGLQKISVPWNQLKQ